MTRTVTETVEPCGVERLLGEFETHTERLRKEARFRRENMRMKAAVIDTQDHEEASEQEMLGKWMPGDEFQGDVNLRTLRALLKQVDNKGFERYAATVFYVYSRHAHWPLRTGRHTNFVSTAPSSGRPLASSTAPTGSSRSRRSWRRTSGPSAPLRCSFR